MTNGTDSVMNKLDEIKAELCFIKEHMVDMDSILTEDDYEALQSYREEKRTKKLTSGKDLRKELGL